jgi:hypothetical protein
VLEDAGPIGNETRAAPVGLPRLRGNPTRDATTLLTRAFERSHGTQSRHDDRIDGRAIRAAHVIVQLVRVVRERVGRMGALVELGQPTAAHLERHPLAILRIVQLHVVLPFDLVADMIFVPHTGGLPLHQPFRAVSEGITPVLMAEATARRRIDRRMPAGISLAVRRDDRVLVVNRLRTRVVGTRAPEMHGMAVAPVRRGRVLRGIGRNQQRGSLCHVNRSVQRGGGAVGSVGAAAVQHDRQHGQRPPPGARVRKISVRHVGT